MALGVLCKCSTRQYLHCCTMMPHSMHSCLLSGKRSNLSRHHSTQLPSSPLHPLTGHNSTGHPHLTSSANDSLGLPPTILSLLRFSSSRAAASASCCAFCRSSSSNLEAGKGRKDRMGEHVHTHQCNLTAVPVLQVVTKHKVSAATRPDLFLACCTTTLNPADRLLQASCLL